jgi:hypothetical protein
MEERKFRFLPNNQHMKAKVTYTETNTVKPKAKQPSRPTRPPMPKVAPKETHSGLRGSVALPGGPSAQEAGPKETQSGLGIRLRAAAARQGSVALPGGLSVQEAGPKETAPVGAPAQPTPSIAAVPAVPVTTIEAKVDVGCGNGVFIRGEGAGLSWEKGKAMDCVEASRWVWSTNQVPDKLVFKVLLNDQGWSQGENVTVAAGQKIEVAPVF